jgi:hypothetical protein
MQRSFLSMLAVLLSGFAAVSAAFAEDSGSLPGAANKSLRQSCMAI